MKTITKKAYGKNIKITDARDNFDLAINNAKGNTEQDTTSGKNLLDCSGLTATTTNEITFTPVYDDKGLLEYINANGTPTKTSSFLLNKKVDNVGDVIITGCPSGGSANTYRITIDIYKNGAYSATRLDAGSGVRVNADEYDYLWIYIMVYGGVTASNLKFYPMIRLATITDATYEPFTNGASPNPSYPQEIKSVVLSEIKTCGKNLLDYSALLYGGISSEDGYTLLSSTSILYSPYFTKVKRGESYIFNVSQGARIYKYDANKKFIESVIVNGAFFADCDYIRYQSSYFTEESQLELGTVSTDFEPYTESVATLSNTITLNGLNGVQDYIDAKRGVLIKRFKEVVLSSSMNWKVMDASSTLGHNVFYTVLSDYNFRDGDSLNYMCTHLTAISQNERYKENTVFMGSNKWFVCCPKDYITLDDWKAFLASTEVKVTYELAEPIETPLPEADVEALKSLKTYDGVTHIFTDSEIKPELEVEYTLLEAKNEWRYTDYFQHTDYNRIAGNINYLKAYLDTLFAELTNTSTIEEKTAKSLIYAREINAIETALETLNLETYKFDIGETKEYMANTRTLNFEDLNRIESAIFMLAEQMTNHKENLSRLAFRLGGQKGIRV